MQQLVVFSAVLGIAVAAAWGQQPDTKAGSRPSETRRSDDATIVEVAIWGLGENSPDDIRGLLKAKRGAVVSKDKLKADCDAIETHLKSKGFIYARATADAMPVDLLGAVVIIRIVEGPRTFGGTEKSADTRPSKRK